MNHTPGPWRIEPNYRFEPDIVKDNEKGTWPDCGVICTMNGPIDFSGNDARLIAAAPELLKHLKLLIASAETTTKDLIGFEGANRLDYSIDCARAAIAKAEGR